METKGNRPRSNRDLDYEIPTDTDGDGETAPLYNPDLAAASMAISESPSIQEIKKDGDNNDYTDNDGPPAYDPRLFIEENIKPRHNRREVTEDDENEETYELDNDEGDTDSNIDKIATNNSSPIITKKFATIKIDTISTTNHSSSSNTNNNNNDKKSSNSSNDDGDDGPPMYDPHAVFSDTTDVCSPVGRSRSNTRHRDNEDDSNSENKNDSNDNSEDGAKVDNDSNSDDDDDEEEEEEDEDYLPRTRARSKSVMDRYEPENEKGIVLIDAKSIQELAAAAAANATGEGALLMKPLEKITERKGPLQLREVEALKKGIEEAVAVRSAEVLKEEKEEKIAAEEERKKRSSLSKIEKSNVDPRRVKILMLGDSGVGKSSLMLRYTADTFSTDLIGTVGVNFKNRKVHVDGEVVLVQVWDTAGQEQFHRITSSYYKSANGIMLVFDVSDKKSQENVEYWIKNIKSYASDTVHVALIGNKVDLRSVTANSSSTTATATLSTTTGEISDVAPIVIPPLTTTTESSSSSSSGPATVASGKGLIDAAAAAALEITHPSPTWTDILTARKEGKVEVVVDENVVDKDNEKVIATLDQDETSPTTPTENSETAAIVAITSDDMTTNNDNPIHGHKDSIDIGINSSQLKEVSTHHHHIHNSSSNSSSNNHTAKTTKTSTHAATLIPPAIHCVDFSYGQNMGKLFSVPYFETSAKDDLNVDKAFTTLVMSIIEASDSAAASNGSSRLSFGSSSLSSSPMKFKGLGSIGSSNGSGGVGKSNSTFGIVNSGNLHNSTGSNSSTGSSGSGSNSGSSKGRSTSPSKQQRDSFTNHSNVNNNTAVNLTNSLRESCTLS